MKRLTLFALCVFMGATTAYASTVGIDGPFGTTVFVRGGFNDWSTSDAMTWDESQMAYEAVLTIEAGSWEFKIADDGWSNPDFGPTGDPIVTLGAATDIGTAIGQNFSLTLASAGQYLFRLSDLSGDLSSGTLTVTAVPIPAAFVLFGSALAGLGVLRRRR